MKGSGLSEIVIEAGVCASGSSEKVMSEKQFNRALRVHKVTLEALKRLLLEKFEMSLPEDHKLSNEASEVVLNLAKNLSAEALQHLMENKACCALSDTSSSSSKYEMVTSELLQVLAELHGSGLDGSDPD